MSSNMEYVYSNPGSSTNPPSSTPNEPNPTNPCVVDAFYVNYDEVDPNYEEEEDTFEVDGMEEDEVNGTDTGDTGTDVEPTGPFKRKRKSLVWKDLTEPKFINQKWMVKCKHCLCDFKVLKSGSTSHYKRHLATCPKKALNLRQQSMLNFLPTDRSAGTPTSTFVNALHDGHLDMMKMREGIAHWIVMHEKPFSVVEEEGFNLMLKRGIPQWKSVSRHTIRNDAFKTYEIEKKKVKDLLKRIDKISLTTDLWKSKPQKIEYMVITAHFVDEKWKLQKRILSFVHIPPPRKGRDIANCMFKCLKEWDIEKKDVSNVREVPDHQELYVDPGRDESLIFELLDLKTDVADHGSATWFLRDLANEQDAEGTMVLEQSAVFQPDGLRYRSSPAIITTAVGQMAISKGGQGRDAQNIVKVYLANLRLKDVATDVLVTAYEPMLINPLSVSAATVGAGLAVLAAQSGCMPMADVFKSAVSSFNVKNWGLFGGET